MPFLFVKVNNPLEGRTIKTLMKMNVKRLIFAVLFMATASSTFAYDFSAVAPTGQTLFYTIMDDGSVWVAQGEYASTEPSGNLVIPASVTDGENTYLVTSIGSNAFYNCRSLTSVTIPSTVTHFGEGVLQGCTALTSVSFQVCEH